MWTGSQIPKPNTDVQDLPAGYRLTELGPLPEEWRVVRLGDLLKQRVLWVKNGFPQGGFNEEGKGVPHLRPFNINDSGEISLHQIKYVPPPPDDSPYWLRKGDILFNNTNSEDLVGKVAYFDREGTFVLSNHMTIVRVLDKRVLNNTWLAWWLLHLWYRGFTQSLARRHVNQASISLARLRGIPIPLPPLPEQRAIAHVLRAVQRAKEATEQVIAAARELKKSLMRHLFTYGPVPVDQTDRVPLQETEIGPLPAHWRVVRLGEVVHKPQYGYTASATQELVGPKFLRITDIQNERVYWRNVPFCAIQDNLLNKYRLQEGDILFARIGATTGKTYLVTNPPRAVFASYLIRVRTHSNQLLPAYLHFFTHTSQYWQQINAAKGGRLKQGINIPILTALPIPLPPLDEQREIARLLQVVDEKIRAEEGRKEALEALFKTLLHDLMTAQRRLPAEFIARFEEENHDE